VRRWWLENGEVWGVDLGNKQREFKGLLNGHMENQVIKQTHLVPEPIQHGL
jgi:hypothetical protein